MVLSIYRNVKTKGNEVEITVVHDRLPFQQVDGESVEQWLNTMKRELQHSNQTARGTLPDGTIRIGLKYEKPDVPKRFMHSAELHHSLTEFRPCDDLGIEDDASGQIDLPTVGSLFDCRCKDQRMEISERPTFHQRSLCPTPRSWCRCALTGVELDFMGSNAEFSPSLDRKDSSGHYEPGNLQIVARFANRWKSDMSDPQFLSLLEAVRRV
jgi:hypothetical protein